MDSSGWRIALGAFSCKGITVGKCLEACFFWTLSNDDRNSRLVEGEGTVVHLCYII